MTEFQTTIILMIFILIIMLQWGLMIGISEMKKIRKTIEKQKERNTV